MRSLAGVVEASGDAISRTTLDDVIVSWNPAAERIYGFTAGEAIGRPVSLLTSAGHATEAAERLTRLRSCNRANAERRLLASIVSRLATRP